MKIVLVEADYLDSNGDSHTLYLANAAFGSSSGDSPAHQPYDDYILGGLKITSAIDELLLGATQVRFSNIEIVNLLSDEVLQGNFSDQAVRVYYGDRGSDKSAFTLIVSAIAQDLITIDEQRLALQLKSHGDALTKPLQQIATGDIGNNKPIAYGQCVNVSPVVSNKSTFTYSVNETPVSAITARKAGVSVSKTDNLSQGEFSLTANPSGMITCDVTSSINTAKTIILDVLNRVSITDIDNASLDTLPNDAIALYLNNNETALTSLDYVVNSFGYFWAFKRSGEFFVGNYQLGQTSTAILYPDEIKQSGMKVLRTIKPSADVELTYNLNWTAQVNSLDASVSLTDREKYQASGLQVTAENAGILTQFPNAQTRKAKTLLTEQVPAQAEVDRRAALLNTVRRIYQIKAFSVPFSFELGQTITVIYPFLGFTEGKDVVVVSITDDVLNGLSTIEVFG